MGKLYQGVWREREDKICEMRNKEKVNKEGDDDVSWYKLFCFKRIGYMSTITCNTHSIYVPYSIFLVGEESLEK